MIYYLLIKLSVNVLMIKTMHHYEFFLNYVMQGISLCLKPLNNKIPIPEKLTVSSTSQLI